MQFFNDEAIRDFVIAHSGADGYLTDIYDKWTELSPFINYDHSSANAFLLAGLENTEPGAVLQSIMSGFYNAAVIHYKSLGITVNEELKANQLQTLIESMSSISELENYDDIISILNSDATPTDKLQKVFEILGPGQDIEYEAVFSSVEPTVIDALREIIENIPNKEEVQDPVIKVKINEYEQFKLKTSGSLFSDHFAQNTAMYNLPIDFYITNMKMNEEFYTQSNTENYIDFIIDVYGCLILSNAQKKDYIKTIEAAAYEFFHDSAAVSRVLVQIPGIVEKLQ